MSETVLSTLLHQALLLSAAIVLLAVARRPLRHRLGAGAAYAAWLLVPALLLTPLLPRPAQEPLQVVLHAAGRSSAPALPALPAPGTQAARVWLALWLAGTAALAGRAAWRQWRLGRQAGRLPAGSSPALVGLLRPRVALPVDFEQRFSAAERELILAHEQVHRDRLDNLWNLLAYAVTALHWWNPLVWWAAGCMRADQELACDAAVLAARPGTHAHYARALLTAHQLTPHGAPLASRWGTTHPLVQRIAMLDQPRPLTRRIAALLSAGVAAISAVAYATDNPAPAPAGNGIIELQLRVERTQGGDHPQQRTTVAAQVITQDGKRTELQLNAIPSDAPSWATEPLWISLLAQKQGGAALIQAKIRSGDAGVELAHPSVLTAWGQKARIEINRPDAQENLVLELTPTVPPAEVQPLKPTF